MGRTTCCALVLAVVLTGCSAHEFIAAAPSTTPSVSATVRPSESPSAAPSTSQTTTRLIDHVLWTRTDKGRQLQVFPTSAGRTAPDGDSDAAWKQVLADAPNADTPGMEDQFLCHWEFARVVDPDKPSWNLEPWRPAVGWLATVAAECNPGGSEG